MYAIVQTNFNGIDALTIRTDYPKPAVTPNDVLIKMTVLPVVPTDWKRESNPNATTEQLADLPRIIGVGGVGTIVAVGDNRDPQLLNQRVLVMNPSGSYSEYVLSENPNFTLPLPNIVTNESAAALTAGPGTALTLKHEIDQSTARHIVITGANSVIGLYLLQMLQTDSRQIWPIVSPNSQTYFQQQMPTIKAYTAEELPTIEADSLIIDIAGSVPLLDQLTQYFPHNQIVSIVLMHADFNQPIKFVHEDFNADDYRHFIQQLVTGELVAPIDRTFPITAIKTAQHYAQDTHSRGRVLVTF